MGLINFCNKTIEYAFYALFFLVPLIFSSSTSELFELNKMWLTWGITIIIAASWFTKMIALRTFRIPRTPLDIPLALFLASQIIATIFSLDQRISWWGYYSRFNGGLLSIITYLFLYYAFVANLGKREVLRTLIISLISGLIVALWGLPSHFGYDPTCLLFRGTFDVSCWTDAFKPTIRIFSTLGQPAWLAAYLAILLPITMAFFLNSNKNLQEVSVPSLLKKPLSLALFLLVILFYLDLTYTGTRAGFLGFWAANIFFWGTLFLTKSLPKRFFIRSLALFNLSFIIISFFTGTTFAQLDQFTFQGIQNRLQSDSLTTTQAETVSPNEGGVTDSADIRLIVWEGAIGAWKANPILGTGVETFAFAYYRHRPIEHNLTSEWDYLYNKAHNEYVNYLTTTGAVGLLAYLSVIGVILFLASKHILSRLTALPKTQEQQKEWVLQLSLIAAFGSILITNFFGFSVVITNLYLFLIPAFYLLLHGSITQSQFTETLFKKTKTIHVTPTQWTGVGAVWLISLYCIVLLMRFWIADSAYALGSNLQRAGDVQGAYTQLTKAVQTRPTEPVFQDEYAINLATLATALVENDEATTGAQLAQEAVALSNNVVANHPNNITFWKSRVRIFYALSQIDPQYLSLALEAIQTAHSLAPTDAKVMYNLGVLQGQNNNPAKAIETLTQTITIKPDYRDAYFARALFYRELATSTEGTTIDQELQQKAESDLNYILKNLNPYDEQAQKTLESWGGQTQ